MKTLPRRRRSATLALAIILLLLLTAAAAGPVLAEGDDMQGMPGMSEDEMQNMTTPGAAAADEADGHAVEGGAHGTMSGSSVNWLVIGGFVVLVVGSTVAAVATKRHLRRRMLAGELAGAGVQNV